MTSIASLTKSLSESGRASLTDEGPPACGRCFGSGQEVIVRGEKRGARPCQCRRQARLARLLETIPPKYQSINLPDIIPDPRIHPSQPLIIPRVQRSPFDNFILWGDNSTGKSMLLWAIYRHAGMNGRTVYGANAKTLLKDYQNAITASREGRQYRPRLTAEDLMVTRPPWTICLDEFDKPNVSAWTAAELFEVIDAAFNYRHQIVVASNLSPSELWQKWEVDGGSYGRSIGRRLLEGSVELKMRKNNVSRIASSG